MAGLVHEPILPDVTRAYQDSQWYIGNAAWLVRQVDGRTGEMAASDSAALIL